MKHNHGIYFWGTLEKGFLLVGLMEKKTKTKMAVGIFKNRKKKKHSVSKL